MKTITLSLSPEEVTIVADALSDMVDELQSTQDSPLLCEKANALLTKIEKVEQSEVFPH